MTQESLPNPLVLPGVIEKDAPCRRCGYNVRGMKTNGLCPECGTPVGTAIFGDLLKYSQPGWVRNLARGAAFIYWGFFWIILAGIMAVILYVAVVAANAGTGRPASPIGLAAVGLAVVVIVAAYVLAYVGWWLLTSADPSGLGEDQYGTSRKIIRVSLAINILSYFVELSKHATLITPQVLSLFDAFELVAGIATLIGIGAQLHYFENLAERIPEARLAASAHSLKTVFPIIYFLMLIFSAVPRFFIGAARPGVTPVMFSSCFAGVCGLGVLFCFLRYVRIIRELGKAIAVQAGFSQTIWAQHGPGPTPI